MLEFNVIGFWGLKSSGKGECAKYLGNLYGYVPTKFAAGLKNMLRSLYRDAGYTTDEIERRIEGDLKETPCAVLGGRSPRHAMETLGTEWGREQIAKDLWFGIWSTRADILLAEGKRLTIDDVRFPNECEAIQARGGIIVKITRPGLIAVSHQSEQHDLTPYVAAEIVNSGSLSDLRLNLSGVLRRIPKAA